VAPGIDAIHRLGHGEDLDRDGLGAQLQGERLVAGAFAGGPTIGRSHDHVAPEETELRRHDPVPRDRQRIPENQGLPGVLPFPRGVGIVRRECIERPLRRFTREEGYVAETQRLRRRDRVDRAATDGVVELGLNQEPPRTAKRGMKSWAAAERDQRLRSAAKG
jgi:hypothetical protein